MRYWTNIIFLIVVFSSCTERAAEVPESETLSIEPKLVHPSQGEYGLVLDDLEVKKGKIGRNQFLADILLGQGVGYPIIEKLVEMAAPFLDVRKIRAGDEYALVSANDSVERLAYFIYEEDPVNYVVFNLNDTLSVHAGVKEVVTVEKHAMGEITTSLYEALGEQEADPMLAMKLANIYAWTVDFYRLQKGDKFNVVYEEKLVDGERYSTGKIVAASFKQGDRDRLAFYFEQDSVGDYFDEEGNSLRKAFLKAPLKFSRMSSGFTKRRFHPVQKRYKAHLGTDYAAPKGTPIMAVGDGTVIKSSWTSGNGKYVKIKHNSTYTTQYLHMSKRAVKSGQQVRQGDIIGYVGSTGLATGPHVCFRFWKNGQQVDHRREEFPPSEPIKETRRQAFMQVVEEGSTMLRSLEEEQDPSF